MSSSQQVPAKKQQGMCSSYGYFPPLLSSSPSPTSHLIFTLLTIFQISKQPTPISKIRFSKLLQKSAILSRKPKSTSSSFFLLLLALFPFLPLSYFDASCNDFGPRAFKPSSLSTAPIIKPQCSSTYHYHTANLIATLD